MDGDYDVEEEVRPGYYKDEFGNWQKDRRKGGPDRRLRGGSHADHERRKFFRRKADRELFERDHRQMIEDALEDFAEEEDEEV